MQIVLFFRFSYMSVTFVGKGSREERNKVPTGSTFISPSLSFILLCKGSSVNSLRRIDHLGAALGLGTLVQLQAHCFVILHSLCSSGI